MAKKKRKSTAKPEGRSAGPEVPGGLYRPFRDLRKILPEPPERPPPAPAPPPREPERDDDGLFRTAMSGVDRGASSRPARVTRSDAPPVPPPEDEFAFAEKFLSSMVDGEVPFDFCDSDEYVEGSVRGFDRKTIDKLRRGEFAVEAHLDLHGLDRKSAKQAVRRFIEQCQVSEKRCVLLVHGRGLRSKDHVPVLKEMLRTWLARGGIGRRVLAFTSARPCDGGAGALYVLLRRLREPPADRRDRDPG